MVRLCVDFIAIDDFFDIQNLFIAIFLQSANAVALFLLYFVVVERNWEEKLFVDRDGFGYTLLWTHVLTQKFGYFSVEATVV